MNIFILDRDPKRAAEMQCDKHVVKMVLESAQILSTVQYLRDKDHPYKPTHQNHPCVVWAGASDENYAWLWCHFWSLCGEYQIRYNRVHKCEQYAGLLCPYWYGTDHWRRFIGGDCENLRHVLAMPDQYRALDPVTAYRDYYINEKAYMARWAKGRPAPEWWPYAENNTC